MRTFTSSLIPVALILILALVLMLSGCGVLSTLQVIVDATAAAVPILQAAGVPIPPALPLYVAAVADCIGNANTTNPTTGELATIAACLATQIEPSLPAGTPQAIANIIAAIAQDVANFVSQNDVQALKANPSASVLMSPRERAKLQQIVGKAKLTAVQARKLVHP